MLFVSISPPLSLFSPFTSNIRGGRPTIAIPRKKRIAVTRVNPRVSSEIFNGYRFLMDLPTLARMVGRKDYDGRDALLHLIARDRELYGRS